MKTLQNTVDHLTEGTWLELCESYPCLVRFNPPKIVLCNRLWRTAGKCYQPENRIHLGAKFFARHTRNMLRVILPHEIAHQADYDIFGESELSCGHGRRWQEIMIKLGLDPNPYHTMEI